MAVITVNAGGNIQTAIDSANPGDIIELEAGATWDVATILSLPDAGATLGNEITITSTETLPEARVSPADAPSMPRLRATNSDAIFRTAANAGFWILDSLNMTDDAPPGTQAYSCLIDIAATNAGGHDMVVQRCLMYPKEVLTDPGEYNRPLARGVQHEGSGCLFRWNYGYGFTQRDGLGQSANTSVILNITGSDLTIHDNFLEGGYVSFFTGGAAESPQYTATLTGPTTTSATFSSVTGLVDDVTFVRFEIRGAGTFNSSTSFTRTSGATPTSDDVNHTVFIVHGAGTWRAKITGVSGNNWTLESYGGPLPNAAESCTWTEFLVAKVTNIAGSVVTYDGAAATVGQNWLTQTPSTAANAAGWREDQVVHDIVITRNTFNIDLAAAQFEHAAHGNSPKGWVEFKAGDGILMDGNYMTGAPSVIGVTQHSNEGFTPWTKVNNLTVTNNYVASVYESDLSRQFLILSLIDPFNSDEPGCCTIVQNNLILGGCIVFMQSSGNATTLVSHNTVLNNAGGIYGNCAVFAEGGPAFGWTFIDNIVGFILNGMSCQISPNTQGTCFPSGVFNHNVVVDATGAGVNANTWGTASILNPVPTSFDDVGFEDAGNSDYRLAASSDFKGAGTAGSDPGVSWTDLVAALGFNPANVQEESSVLSGQLVVSGRVAIT